MHELEWYLCVMLRVAISQVTKHPSVASNTYCFIIKSLVHKIYIFYSKNVTFKVYKITLQEIVTHDSDFMHGRTFTN
jgi:hypothetical protein